MVRRSIPSPDVVDRLREARAAEDAALADVARAQAVLDTATTARADALARADDAVADAQAGLSAARVALVTTSGLARAAMVLDLPLQTLRRAVSSSQPAPGPVEAQRLADRGEPQ
jgi:hypothetical protein